MIITGDGYSVLLFFVVVVVVLFCLFVVVFLVFFFFGLPKVYRRRVAREIIKYSSLPLRSTLYN